jgi:hypothetical protein
MFSEAVRGGLIHPKTTRKIPETRAPFMSLAKERSNCCHPSACALHSVFFTSTERMNIGIARQIDVAFKAKYAI